jgi:uncharacterized protein (TIGR02466 family)
MNLPDAAVIDTLFVTRVYRAPLGGRGLRALNAALKASMEAIAVDDGAGRRWSQTEGYAGYTSYASLNDLTWRDPAFAALSERLAPHIDAFARALAFDLNGRALTLDSLWINVLEPGGMHSGHIHPSSVISGTYYVHVPPGSGGLRLEDPRLALMMAAPPRRANAPKELSSFHVIAPKAGDLVLWESWLRHEVLINRASAPRLSVSFNVRWDA